VDDLTKKKLVDDFFFYRILMDDIKRVLKTK